MDVKSLKAISEKISDLINRQGHGIVITVANPKGGVGKSSVAATMAHIFSSLGLKTECTDADNQASLIDFYEERSKNEEERGTEFSYFPKVTGNSTESVVKVLKAARNDSQIIIVDTQGEYTNLEIKILKESDFCVIPMLPNMADFRKTEIMLEAVYDIQEAFGKPVMAVLVNNYDGQTIEARKVIKSVESKSVPLFASKIPHSTVISNLWGEGKTIVDFLQLSTTKADKQKGDKLFHHHKRFMRELMETVVAVLDSTEESVS